MNPIQLPPPQPKRILIVEKLYAHGEHDGLARVLQDTAINDLSVQWVSTPDETTAALADQHWNLILCNVGNAVSDSVNLIRRTHQAQPGTPVIVTAESGTVQDAVAIMRMGARAFVTTTDHEHLLEYINEELDTPAQSDVQINDQPLLSVLQATQARYDGVVEYQPELICRYDSEFRITFVNRAYSNWRGVPAAALLGTQITNMVPEDDLERAIAHVQSLTADHPVKVSIHRSIMPDQSQRWFEWTDQALLNAEGQIFEYQSIGRDITDRMTLSESLHVKNVAIESSITPIALADLEGHITYVNPALLKLWKYDSDKDVLGKTVAQFWKSPEDIQMVVAELYELGAYSGTLVAQLSDGSTADIQLSATLVKDADGKPICIMGSFVDMSERKRTEEALRDSQAQLNALLSAFPDLIFRIGADGTYLDILGPETDLLFPKAATIGKKLEDISLPSEATSSLNLIRQVIKTRQPTVSEYRLTVNGRDNIYEARTVPLQDLDEVITIVRDITARRKQEILQNRISQILEAIAEAQSLPTILEKLVLAVEESNSEIRASVLLLDNNTNRLHTGAAPNLPDAYNTAIEGLQIGTGVGSCGTAAFEKRLVIVEDIQTDPLWFNFKDLASEHGLRACWSQPIMDHNESVLGTFALYYNQPRSPSDEELALIRLAAHLAGIAIRRTQTEAALRKSEDLFQRFMRHSPDVVVIYDHRNHVTYCNAQYAETFGLKTEDIIGKTIEQYGPLELAQVVSVENEQVRNEKKTIDFIYSTQESGRELHWQITKFPIPQDDGVPLVAAIGHDITNETLAEVALRTSEEKYRTLIESSDAAISMIGLDGRFLFANKVISQQFGVPREVIVGKSLDDFFPPQRAHLIMEGNTQAITQDAGFNFEDELIIASKRYWFRISVQPVKDGTGKPYAAMIHATDITSMKEAENALRASEEKYRSLIESSDATISMLDQDGRYLYLNEIAARPFGMPAETLVGKTVYELFSVPQAEAIQADVQRVITQNIGIVLEPEVTINGKSCWFRTSIQPVWDAAGKPYAALIHATEITDKKEAEFSLQASQERYRRIVEDQTELVCRYDNNFLLTFGNQAYCTIYGLSPDELMGKSIFDKIPLDEHEAALSHLRSMTPDNPVAITVHQSIMPDQSVRWTEWKDRALFDEQGNVVEYQGVGRDITEQKRAEEAVRASEMKLRSLINSQTNYVIRTDLQGKYTYWNNKFEQDFASHLDSELAESSALDLICDYHHDRARETVEKCLSQPGTIHKVELDKRLRDGSITTTLWEFTCLADVDGNPSEMQCMGINITDRKQSEDALRASELRYRQMFELHGLPKLIIDPDTARIIDANPAAAQFYGYDVETLQTLTMFDVSLSSADLVRSKMMKAATSDMLSCEFVHRGAQNQARNVEVFTGPVEIDGQKLLYSVITDITEKVHAKDALQKAHDLLEARVIERTVELERAKNRLEAIFEHSGDSILLLDVDKGIQQANHAFEDLLGIAAAAYLDKQLTEYFDPLDTARINAIIKDCVESHQTHRIETHTWRSDGTTVDVEMSIAPVNRSENAVTNLVCIIRDVSERKRDERALRDSEVMLQNVINNMPVHILWTDTQSVYQGCNSLFAQSSGLASAAEIVGKSAADFYPEQTAEWEADDRLVMATGQSRFNVEQQLRADDGTITWLRSNKVVLLNSEGVATGVLMTVEDITDRKQAELAIAEERNLLRTLIDTSPDYIYIKDLQHRFLLTNKSHAHARNSASPEDLIGKTDFDFFPPELAQQFRDEEEVIFRTGQPLLSHEQTSHGHGSGFVWASSNKVPLRNLDGEVIGLVGITHDITQLKANEEALRQNEKALQESRNMLRLVLDTIPVRVFWKDNNFNYLGCNRLFASDAKLKAPDEIVGHTDFELFPNEAELYRQDDHVIIATGDGKLNFEEPQTKGDGSQIWLRTSKIPLRNADGEIIGVIGTYDDITERKRQETEIRESRNMLQLVLDTIPVGVFWKDHDSIVLGCNKLFAQDAGFDDVAALLGQEGKKRAIPKEEDKFRADELAIMETGVPRLGYEEVLTPPNRASLIVQTNKLPLLNANGEIIGILGAYTDITARKQAEAALQQKYEEEREMQSYLKALHEVTLHLTRTTTLDEFYRCAVEQGMQHFRFERLGLLLYDKSDGSAVGTYGADPEGNVVAQPYLHLEPGSLKGIFKRTLDGNERFVFDEHAQLYFANSQPLGTGQNAVAALWDGEILGWLAIDNAAHGKPISKAQLEILVLYAITAGSLLARKRAEFALHQKYEEEREMQSYLKALHEVTLRLTRTTTLDEFYRCAVEQGLQQFGFERMGLWLYNVNIGLAVGTYGTDIRGQIIDEHHLSFRPDSASVGVFKTTWDQGERLGFDANAQLYEYNLPIGTGENALAVLWDGEALGWFAIDNAIHHKPISKAQLEVLALYAITAGSLLARKRAEFALRESESRYRLLAENVRDVITRLTPEASVTFVTPSIQNLVGYTADELIGKNSGSLVHADDLVISRETVRKAFQEGTTYFTLIERLLHKDGHYVWVEMTNSVVYDPESRNPIEVIGVIRDITQRREAEEALRESETRYRLLAENILDVIVRMSPQGSIIFATPSIQNLLGYAPGELIGLSGGQITHDDDRVRTLEVTRRALGAGDNYFTFPVRLRHKSGHYVWIEMTTTVVYSTESHLPLEYITVIRDITQRRAAEEALRESESRYRLLAENIQDVIYKSSPNTGLFTYLSPSVYHIIGYRPEELVGTTGLEQIHPDDLAATVEAFQQNASSKATYFVVTNRMQHKAGHYVWVETTTTIVRDPVTGEAIEFVGTVHDVSERVRAQEVQAALTQRLELATLAGGLGIWDWNLTDNTLIWDDRMLELYGIDRKDFTGTLNDWTRSIVLDDAERVQTSVVNSVMSGVPYDLEFRVRWPDQSIHYIKANAVTLRAADGTPQRMVGVNMDVTDRRQAEAALQISEERLRQAVRTSKIGIFEHDHTTNLLYFSPEYRSIYGWEPDEVITSEYLDSFPNTPAEDVNRIREEVNRAHDPKGDGLMEVERQIIDRNGGSHWVISRSRTFFEGEAGSRYPVRTIGAVLDISERKKAETALQDSEEKFRLFTESAPIATIITDHEGEIVLVNREAEKLFGYDRAELAGKNIEQLMPEDIRHVHGQKHRPSYMKEPDTRRAHALEAPARRKDGTLFPADIQLSYIDAHPTPMVMSFVIDVTQRKQAEDLLKQSLAHERELGELKSRFVSMASHEFRTPLASILATTETLTIYRAKMDQSQIDNRLDKIRQQVMHMKDIMEDVLQLARIQAGRVEYNPVIGDLNRLCQEIVEEFDSLVEYEGRLLYSSISATVFTTLDVRLMRQVISNLISNALKYSDSDKAVKVELTQDEEQVVLKVTDEGIGIPPDDLKHLFEPFHRATNVGTISGTGLGLSITKQAVELHGGTIVPQSELGSGTTFTVSLPKAGRRVGENG